MPSVNIRDPYTEAAYHEGGQDRAPARAWGRVLCRAPWLALLGGVLALAAMLKG